VPAGQERRGFKDPRRDFGVVAAFHVPGRAMLPLRPHIGAAAQHRPTRFEVPMRVQKQVEALPEPVGESSSR